MPTLLYIVRPKRPSGNCYVSFFLTEKTPLFLVLCHNHNISFKFTLRLAYIDFLFSIILTLVKWEKVDNDWYMIEDALAESTTFEKAKQFCESIGDNVFLFEPRSATTLSSLISKLALGDKFLWANVYRGTDTK